MDRYSLFEGVKGCLCPHPSAVPNSRRHPGMKRRPLAEGEKLEHLSDLYEPVQEVFAEHKCLRKAVEAGHLKRVKGPIVAKDIIEAMTKLGAMPKAAKKGKD